MKKFLYASVLAAAIIVMGTAFVALAQNSGQSTITIRDPAEYNAYTSAAFCSWLWNGSGAYAAARAKYQMALIKSCGVSCR